ncbi:MAG: 2-hydroxyacyl-CoA dehydratase [Christensenellales bacterium]|jgi:benzoyl-CoA reductase/2-hydroxyglutaryl-CoA dehydratase subunit BcrC/BadD/HgdB
MDEFLALCGFSEHERLSALPRVREVFARLGVSEDDVERGKIRLTTYYDMELEGIRKLVRIILNNLCNTVLMRDTGRTKIVHACMAPGMDILGSAIMEYSRNVGIIDPNFTFMFVLGAVFDKYVPVLESAERQWLKGGVAAHCGMVKSRLGLISLGMVPRPDLTITTGFACDTSPRTNELLEEIHGIPACYVDTCQDRELSEYPNAGRATAFAAKSMRAAAQRIEQETGFQITDRMLFEVLEARRPLDLSLGRLFDLIQRSDPLPFASSHLNVLSVLGSISFCGPELGETIDAIDTLHGDLLERSRRGVGATPKGAPRVLAIFPHHHTDPRWEHMANEMGVAIIACDFQGTPQRGADTTVVDPNDPYEIIVQHLNGVFTQPLGGRVATVLDLCRRLKVNGVLNHYHLGCRYVVGDMMILRDAILRELGIPVLMIEWDNFDPRSFNREQYETKLQTFRSMM